MSARLLELQAQTLQRLKLAGAAGLLVAGVLVASGVMSRQHSEQAIKAWTTAAAIPTVDVISLNPGASTAALTLPGAVQAYYEAPIHARVSGYLKQWYEDIGAHVKAGQLLASIDTPELDQQLAQARADLATAEANLSLAQITAKRWQHLLADDAVSPQEADEKSGDLAAKTALVNAARANVDRLVALESFKNIVAPFDGVVTARKTDIGALISAGGDSGPELFSVADVHRLRVYVRVPQSYSAAIKPGLTAALSVPEYPGQSFTATLSSTADAVNDQSGTLLVELGLDNANGQLKPGDYAEVHFSLPQSGSGVQVPASALVYRQQGLQVATLGPDSHVVMKNITIARDDGSYVEVAAGLSRADRIIDSPPDSLAQGDLVRVSGASAAAAGVQP